MQTEWIGCRPRPRRLWRGARPTRRSTTCDGRWRNPYPGEATPGAARLGAAEATANDPAAEATLDRARRLATDPALKRVVTLNLGGVLIASGRYDQAMDALIEELEQVGDDHTGLTAALETLVLATAATTPDRPLSVRAQRIRAAEVDGLAPEIARMRLAVLSRCELFFGGRAAVAGDLADAGRRPAHPRASRRQRHPVLGVWHLTFVGELHRSERYLDGAIALARKEHLTRALTTSLTGRALNREPMGKLHDAEADLSVALRLDAELPMSLTEPVSRAVLCEIRLDRGDVDAAREAITLDLERYAGTVGFRFLRAARARSTWRSASPLRPCASCPSWVTAGRRARNTG